MKLWEKGMLSNETLLQTYGYDMGQEVERRKAEEEKGVPDTLTPPLAKNNGTLTSTKRRRRSNGWSSGFG